LSRFDGISSLARLIENLAITSDTKVGNPTITPSWRKITQQKKRESEREKIQQVPMGVLAHGSPHA
jgi:hypothetical protein